MTNPTAETTQHRMDLALVYGRGDNGTITHPDKPELGVDQRLLVLSHVEADPGGALRGQRERERTAATSDETRRK